MVRGVSDTKAIINSDAMLQILQIHIKKYWKSDFNQWNNGREEYILDFCNVAYHDQIWNKLSSNFKKSNYYNLPYLEDMVWK